MLCHLQMPFNSFRKQLHTKHDSFSGCLAQSHCIWVYFFNRSSTKKIRAYFCVTFTVWGFFSPVNPSLIQLGTGAAKHSTLARAAGVKDSQKKCTGCEWFFILTQ